MTSTEELKKKRREYMRSYRARNPDKVKQWQSTSEGRRKVKGPSPNRREYLRARYRDDPEYRAGQLARTRKNHLLRRYGITAAEREALFDAQGRRCPICRTGEGPWHVDHDHKTGLVRAVLCRACNVLLGAARENVSTLRAAIDYLQR